MCRRSLAFTVLLSFQVVAPNVFAGELARLRLSSGLVEWLPQVNAEELVLRLAGPDGIVRSWWFAAGAVPALALSDESGQPLPDGLYTYELRATPRLPQGLRQQLRSARAAGDEAAVKRLQAEIPQPLVQTGTIRILGGAVLAGERAEAEPGSMAKDQMVPDDLIVDGKGCIGLGCANGESFFSEALRLKQSVVRLRFVDTSTGGGFPTRDWQVAINDASSGGGDRFSIEDLTAGRTPFTIQGNAPDNALFVDASGRIGLRTATPAQDLHVASGNTPALRLEQTTAGGFPARTWDLSASHTAFAVKDVTGAKTPLQINAGAPTGSLTVAADGNVGIGTANPTGTLHISGVATTDVFAGMGVDLVTGPAFNYGYSGFSFGRSSGFFNIRPDASAVPPNPSLRFLTKNIQRMIIDDEGFVGLGGVTNPSFPIHHSTGAKLSAAGTWDNGSSREIKRDITELSAGEAFATLRGLAPVKYASAIDPRERRVGFIAEDVPDLVASQDRKSLSPLDIVAVLTKVAQEQQATIEKQQEVIRQLEERLARLERKQ